MFSNFTTTPTIAGLMDRPPTQVIGLPTERDRSNSQMASDLISSFIPANIHQTRGNKLGRSVSRMSTVLTGPNNTDPVKESKYTLVNLAKGVCSKDTSALGKLGRGLLLFFPVTLLAFAVRDFVVLIFSKLADAAASKGKEMKEQVVSDLQAKASELAPVVIALAKAKASELVENLKNAAQDKIAEKVAEVKAAVIEEITATGASLKADGKKIVQQLYMQQLL